MKYGVYVYRRHDAIHNMYFAKRNLWIRQFYITKSYTASMSAVQFYVNVQQERGKINEYHDAENNLWVTLRDATG